MPRNKNRIYLKSISSKMHIDRSSGKKNEPMKIVMTSTFNKNKKKYNIEDMQTRATTKTEKLMIPNETSFNSKVKFN